MYATTYNHMRQLYRVDKPLHWATWTEVVEPRLHIVLVRSCSDSGMAKVTGSQYNIFYVLLAVAFKVTGLETAT